MLINYLLTPRVINIYNHRAPATLFERLKQLCFNIKIGVHILMKIEMVLRQVRKDANIKINAMNPLQHNGMRRNLHNNGFTSLLFHMLEHRMNIRSLRRGACRRNNMFTNLVGHGTEQPRLKIGIAKNIPNHISGGGLTIRARDAHHLHLAREIAKVSIRDLGQSSPCTRNLKMGHPCS